MASPTFLPGEPPPVQGFPNRQPPVAQPEKLPPGNWDGQQTRTVGQPTQGPATRRRQEANAARRAGFQGNREANRAAQRQADRAAAGGVQPQPPQVPPAAQQLQALTTTMTAPQPQVLGNPNQVPGLNSTYGLPPGARNFA